MAFQASAWLWLFLPWAMLVVLTLRAYRPTVQVPYIDLWPREDERRDEKRRSWRPPPLAILLLLLAIACAIVALARPASWPTDPRIARLTIVLDRGVTMLMGQRLESARETLIRSLRTLLADDAEITIIDPLSPDTVVSPTSLAEALRRPATSVDIGGRIDAIVTSRRDEPMMLLSDRKYDGIVSVAGDVAVENVGIVAATAANGECWLTLRNDSSISQVQVMLSSIDASQRHTVQLPDAGSTREYRLVCPSAMPLRVRLEIADDFADDNVWWILPERVPARITIDAGAPQWLRRFALSYGNATAANELSREVLITTSNARSPHSLCIAAGMVSLLLPDELLLPDHPLTSNVVLPRRVLAGLPLPPGNWQVLLHVDQTPLLAVDDDACSVWIGFTPEGEITPDYLVLLVNAVGFASGVKCTAGRPEVLGDSWEQIEGIALGELPPGSRAGLYRNGDRYHAVNVRSPDLPASAGSALLDEQLAEMAQQQDSPTTLAPWIWILCLVGITGAVCCVKVGENRFVER